MGGELLNYHRFLFQWHSRHFFRFRAHLTRAELAYLEACFELADDFEEVSESGFSHFSYYTYSHRVAGESVNSSRLAYGSVERPEEAFRAALPVLQERAILAPELPGARFYGLGWDVLENQFKLYFRVKVSQIGRLPQELQALAPASGAHRPEGLVSFTYSGPQIVEQKVYLYPLGQPGEAVMHTDRRGAVVQTDVQSPDDWQHRINAIGQRILRLYAERGESLDTIAYQDSDHYTLYFP